MATSQPTSSSGTDRIRSLKDQDSVYKAFDSYPWTKDDNFKSGLHAILGGPSTPNPNDIATHARIFYYAQRIGVQIEFSSYKDWLTRNPGHEPPQVLPEEYLTQSLAAAGSGSQGLPWQQAAPKAELYVDRRQNSGSLGTGSSAASTSAAGAEGQPAYPMAFADMIKMLQEGKEIPGIRQIPNTIVRDPSVKPVGSRAAPRKPWEKDSTQTPKMEFNTGIDTHFPPLEDEAASEANSQQQEGVTSG